VPRTRRKNNQKKKGLVLRALACFLDGQINIAGPNKNPIWNIMKTSCAYLSRLAVIRANMSIIFIIIIYLASQSSFFKMCSEKKKK